MTAMTGRALMTAAQHAAFVEIRESLPGRGVSNVAHVFVPVGPPEDDARPCLMYVGRATRDYGDDTVSTYGNATGRDLEILATQRFAFWAFQRHIRDTVTAAIGPLADGSHAMSAAWSNLAKIGDTKGNPTLLSCSAQATACCEALRSEIEVLRPAVIVVATGPWRQELLLDPVFGTDGWSAVLDRPTRRKIDASSGALVVHTYHPERKRGSRELAVGIGRLVADYLSSSSETNRRRATARSA